MHLYNQLTGSTNGSRTPTSRTYISFKANQLRPKDQDALRKLAGLYLSQANTFQLAAQQAQLDNPTAVVSPIFQPGGKLGQALGTDPIQAALSTKVNTAFQDAVTKMQNAQSDSSNNFRLNGH